MKFTIPTVVFTALIAAPALAEETRSADAHEHGHGSFNMAVEGKTVAIELETPAFDILGFEHEANSDADKATVETARAALADPVALFGLSASAKCEITEVELEIGADADHDDDHHGEEHHDDEHHDEDGHDDHAEDKHDDDHGDDKHAHDDDHAEEKHDDHDDHGDDHADHDGEEAEHSEVHAHYTLTCGASDEIKGVNMTAFFKAFPNAEELDAAILTDAGQASGELEPDSPELSF